MMSNNDRRSGMTETHAGEDCSGPDCCQSMSRRQFVGLGSAAIAAAATSRQLVIQSLAQPLGPT